MKKMSLGLIIGSAVLLAACNQNAAMTTATPSPVAEASPSPVVSMAPADDKTIMQAYQDGASLNCTINNKSKSEAVTFMTKNKKSKSVTAMAATPNSKSYMINDGQYMYIWTSDKTTGFKTQIPTEEQMKTAQAQFRAMSDQVPDFSQAAVQQEYESKGYTINCAPGEINDNEFTPPANVQFQDMSAMMQKAMEGMPQTNQ